MRLTSYTHVVMGRASFKVTSSNTELFAKIEDHILTGRIPEYVKLSAVVSVPAAKTIENLPEPTKTIPNSTLRK